MGWRSKLLPALTQVSESQDPADLALTNERYRALQRQIPLLYTVALANFIGLHLATGGEIGTFYSPVTLLAGFVVVRLVHWMNVRGRTLTPVQTVRELRRTWFYALLVSGGFCAWALSLLAAGEAQHVAHVVLFGSLAAVGCAYGLSSFPAAARLPLLFLGLPIGVWLILTGETANVGMGASLALVILLILRLLGIHNHGFAQLVRSRSDIANERERARRAEKLAKTERTKARLIADTDPLTGLANRRAFLSALTRCASDLQGSGRRLALAAVDLDRFKPINDTFGHAAGDAVLQQIGGRLAAATGSSAFIARTGGDEFALLLPRMRNVEAVRSVGASICAALQTPFFVEGREFKISGCCGLTILSADQSDVAEALIRADTALYQAKAGRGGFAVFSPEMEENNRRRIAIEQALAAPATRAAIDLVYQPIRDLTTGELRAFEALARWEHETLGCVSPAEFIPVAEQTNNIFAISDALLRKAAREARRWADPVRLSFNISAVQLCTLGFAPRIFDILGEAGLSASRLQVEVTETALLVNMAVVRENLQALQSAGARIVIDDFGAGHASISYLREMQFDGIKLDGSMLGTVGGPLLSRRLLKGVLDMCSALGVPCVAEHIECEEQLTLLRELGCRDGQGFLLGHPLHASEAAALARPALHVQGVRAA